MVKNEFKRFMTMKITGMKTVTVSLVHLKTVKRHNRALTVIIKIKLFIYLMLTFMG